MLDLDRIFAECCCLVEWPDRLGVAPGARLDVVIRAPDGAARVATFDGAALADDHPWRGVIESLRADGVPLT